VNRSLQRYNQLVLQILLLLPLIRLRQAVDDQVPEAASYV
jgi:hypothetical protein